MKSRIPFQNPAMRKYEKSSAPSLLPLVIVIVLLALAGRYLFADDSAGRPEAPAAAAKGLPHAELTRWFEQGGNEKLILDCHPEENAAHFYCRVVREINGVESAGAVIDEATARLALTHFFSRWPAGTAKVPAGAGRHSLGWVVSDGHSRRISGEAPWMDAAQAERTAAVLSLEGELAAHFWRD
jgi:hypothetical protein